MAEPTSKYSMRDLVKRVAREAGVAYYGANGNDKAMVPLDKHDLDEVKEVVTDAFKMFTSDAPKQGWRWRRRIASVQFDPEGSATSCINTSATRYKLPADFGGAPAGEIQYSAGTGHASKIYWVDPIFIRDRQAISLNSGHPIYAAIQPYQPASPPTLQDSRRWELFVDVTPTTSDVVIFPYEAAFDNMDIRTGSVTSAPDTSSIKDAVYRDERSAALSGQIITIIEGTGKYESATITDNSASTVVFAGGLSNGTTSDSTATYTIEPSANLHPAGFEYDEVIMAACLAKAEQKIDDVAAGFYNIYVQKELPKAYEKNNRQAPKRLGKMSDGLRLSRVKHSYDSVTFS